MSNSSSYFPCPYINDYGTSYYYVYVHPFIQFTSLLNGIVATLILSQKEVRTSGFFFQYELLFTIQSLIGTMLTTVVSLTKCGYLCSTSSQQWAKIYETFALNFFGQSIFIADSLIQVSITFQIYFSLTPKFVRLSQVTPVKVMSVIDIFGILCGLSAYLVTNINSYTCVANGVVQTVYYSVTSTNSLILSIASNFVFIVANYLFLTLLMVMNALLFNKLRKMMNKKVTLMGKTVLGLSKTNNSVFPMEKSKLSHAKSNGSTVGSLVAEETLNGSIVMRTNEKESKKKTLIMVIYVSMAFAMGRMFSVITNIISLVAYGSMLHVYFGTLTFVWATCVFASQSIILYNTNKIFRKKFRQLILRKNLGN